MSNRASQTPSEQPQINVDEAIAQLTEAAAARKCWSCGVLQNALAAVEEAFPVDRRPAKLAGAIAQARRQLVECLYDGLGCGQCPPMAAVEALGITPAPVKDMSHVPGHSRSDPFPGGCCRGPRGGGCCG